MIKHYFSINIPQQEFLKFYQGIGASVSVRSYENLILKIPTTAFLPFVSTNGVDGIFCLTLGQSNNLVSLLRH